MAERTILVIDDDATFRHGLTEVLKNAGYRTLSAADGREALALIDRHQATIDLMIVDLCLPDANGIEIIAAVTRHKLRIKIIAVSGVFDDMYLEIAKSFGANEWVRKAIGEKAVPTDFWLQTVHRLLGGASGETT